MKRYIITTVGTSLIGNAKKAGKTGDLAAFLRHTDPVEASAETNTLSRLAIAPDDEIRLLYTDTEDGKICGEALLGECKRRVWNTEARSLKLKDHAKNLKEVGLRDLVEVLAEEIRAGQRRDFEVILNATGGFKPETAYAAIIGMVFGIRVIYIHQLFDELVELPPIPINWDTDLFFHYEPFFSWLDEGPYSIKSVQSRLSAMPPEDQKAVTALLTQDQSDGTCYLSTLGDVFWRRFRTELEQVESLEDPPASDRPLKDRIGNSLLHSSHHFPKRENYHSFLQAVAALPYVEEITGGFFENTLRSRLKRPLDGGVIQGLYCDNDKGANFFVRTTAQSPLQAWKLARRDIQPLLDKYSG